MGRWRSGQSQQSVKLSPSGYGGSNPSLPTMLPKRTLEKLYKKGLSIMEIAKKERWPYRVVRYWMERYNIPRRSRSEANYLKYNPAGDPFKIKKLKTRKDIELFNLGIGLFLGEGTKKTKHHVILTNTNPKILKLFLKFLKEICGVKNRKIKVASNIFDDVDLKEALNFWRKSVGISRSMFRTSIIRKSRGGTYKNKSKYGTLTIYVSNTKLKKLIDKYCEEVLNN